MNRIHEGDRFPSFLSGYVSPPPYFAYREGAGATGNVFFSEVDDPFAHANPSSEDIYLIEFCTHLPREVRRELPYLQSPISIPYKAKLLRESLKVSQSASALKELNLSGKNLQFLPMEIDFFSSLKILNLKNNNLRRLPDCFEKMKALEFLFLENNRLEELPFSIFDLANLKCLNLSKNRLAFLPEEIGLLFSLKELYIHDNQIRSLPNSLLNLYLLERLFAEDNEIEAAPEALKYASHLKIYTLDGNPCMSREKPIR